MQRETKYELVLAAVHYANNILAENLHNYGGLHDDGAAHLRAALRSLQAADETYRKASRSERV